MNCLFQTKVVSFILRKQDKQWTGVSDETMLILVPTYWRYVSLCRNKTFQLSINLIRNNFTTQYTFRGSTNLTSTSVKTQKQIAQLFLGREGVEPPM